jgi:hypothetical protein
MLYAKIENHKEALQVLVNELEDHDGAERYCLDNSRAATSRRHGNERAEGNTMTGMEERTGSNELLLLLLETYLFPELAAPEAGADPVEAATEEDLER